MKIGFVPAITLALVLCACGGDDGSAPPTSGGSTPTPSPSPTPTPPPAASYTKFADLTGDQAFQTSCAGTYGSDQLIDTSGFGRPTTVADGLSVDYAAATQSWSWSGLSFSGQRIGFTFTPAMIQPNAPAHSVYYRKDNSDGTAERFFLGSRPLGANPAEYVRTGLLNYRVGNEHPEYRYCVFGVPTLLSDSRPTLTVTYGSAAIGGNAFVVGSPMAGQYDLSDSIVTISANPASGEIPVELTLIGRAYTPSGLSATTEQLGVYRGTATVNGSEQSFKDSITDGDRAMLGGSFAGWFFGPQGAEIAFSFSLMAQNQDGSTITASGAVTARR